MRSTFMVKAARRTVCAVFYNIPEVSKKAGVVESVG
jgi:hypothetical protein